MEKRSLLIAGSLLVLGSLGVGTPAFAGNSSVETALESLGDTSMFYQALLNTGVINELNEVGRYTIFAPVDQSFAQIPQTSYPCFYAEACRPQIAVLLRDHIIDGRHNLDNLVSYGNGLQTFGPRRAHVDEAFVRNYTVNGQPILSETEINGNVIYRIGGVLTDPQELAEFRTVPVAPVADTVTTRTTTVRRVSVPSDTYPGGDMYPEAASVPGNTSTTTVIRSYRTQDQ